MSERQGGGKVKVGHMVVGGGSLAALISTLVGWQWFTTEFEPHKKAYAADALAKENNRAVLTAAHRLDENSNQISALEKSTIRIEARLEDFSERMMQQTAVLQKLNDNLEQDRRRELERLRRGVTN